MDSLGAASNIQWLLAIPPALPPLSATASNTNLTCSLSCTATATATANWGTPPYIYTWNTSPIQHTQIATGLCAGPHTVTIVDSLMATASATITVAVHPPASPVITANGAVLSTSSVTTSYQWYKNDTLITGATSAHYTVTQNGNYTIVVANGNCNDTSNVYNFHTIGINNLSMDNSVEVFPNPATNQITIQFTTATKQNVVIEIKNELGQRVKMIGSKQLTIDKNEMIVNIADLPAGVYFVQIQDQNNTINKKFIKE